MQIKKIDNVNVKDVYKLSTIELAEDSWSLSQFTESLNKENYVTYLAYDDETLLGFLIAMRLADSINLLLIATNSSYKRIGIASKLIDLLIKNHSDLDIWLEVKETNTPALNLYNKLGFKQIHSRKNYYKDGTAAIILEKVALDF